MTETVRVTCLAEQESHAAFVWLKALASVEARPLADLLRRGWDHPLLLLGDGLAAPDAPALIRRAYRNPAPLLILPPLPAGEVTALLGAPAPVAVVHRRADTAEMADDALRGATGRDNLRIYCTEAIETALRTGTLATANGSPVIWAYRPTQASTPVVWVAPQVLLVSARTDPLDREALVLGLLAWAAAQTQPGSAGDLSEATAPAPQPADPALLRALVVAWAVRPDLTRPALPAWLAERLLVRVDAADLETALAALHVAGALDAQDRPHMERISALAEEWGVRAWVREARRLEERRDR